MSHVELPLYSFQLLLYLDSNTRNGRTYGIEVELDNFTLYKMPGMLQAH